MSVTSLPPLEIKNQGVSHLQFSTHTGIWILYYQNGNIKTREELELIENWISLYLLLDVLFADSEDDLQRSVCTSKNIKGV